MAELGWGRRFLVCPPAHFDVRYAINPWMSEGVRVDPERAQAQWETLVRTLVEAGAEVETLEPAPGLPDLVFTANAGVVNGSQFIPARFRHPHRQPEVDHDVAWFESAGFRVDPLPPGVVHEGAGDALPFDGTLVCAYRTRSSEAAAGSLASLTGAPTVAVELVDDRLYHLDLTFCPLDERRAMAAPDAWGSGRNDVLALVPELLPLEADETTRFMCNSVVVGRTIVMPFCTPRVGRVLEQWGFEVVVVDVGEFLKSGGACRCLTLALDVDLRRS